MSEKDPIHAEQERRRGRTRKYGIVAEKPEPPPAPSSLPPILTPEQAASLLQVTANTVRLMCDSGRLPAVDVGLGELHIWRIRLSDVLPGGDPSGEWRERALKAETKLAAAETLLSGALAVLSGRETG